MAIFADEAGPEAAVAAADGGGGVPIGQCGGVGERGPESEEGLGVAGERRWLGGNGRQEIEEEGEDEGPGFGHGGNWELGKRERGEI